MTATTETHTNTQADLEAAAQTYKEESKAQPCAYSRLEFCLHLLPQKCVNHQPERQHRIKDPSVADKDVLPAEGHFEV